MPAADRTTLGRRLSYVLTGLPPNADEIQRFEADSDPQAYERFADSLLRSPHFGENWARHWMDVVRYGDTYGYEWDIPAKGAWRYRDYLIRAFNADVPYDQFVREQIAGDLLPSPRINAPEGINESLIGTMFFQLGENRHSDSGAFNGVHQEMLNNKIDAFSRAFQATTIACAKCHDHKLDAISQRDYYALAGVFMSARWVTNTLDTPARNQETIARLRQLKKQLRGEIGRWWLASDMTQAWQHFLDSGTGGSPVGTGIPSSQPASTNAKTDLPIEDPLHPWQALSQVAPTKEEIAAKWQTLAAEYARLGAERAAANARDFAVVADFTHGIPPGWSADGAGLREGVVRPGDFTVALQGQTVIGRILPAGVFTDSLSPRLNGALRSPMLQFDRPLLSVCEAGGDLSAQRIVVDNAFLTERQTYLTHPDPSWLEVPASREFSGRHVYLEYATKSSNPNFPPRWGLGKLLTKEMIDDPRSWFGVTRIVSHTAAGQPADELARFHSLFDGPPPDSLDEVKARYARWFAQAVEAWTGDRADDEQVRLLNWLVQHTLLPNAQGDAPVARLLAEYRQTEKHLLDPQTANGMADIDPPLDFPLQIRGDYDRLADPVPRGYLEIFGLAPTPARSSGRLELADFVASPADPLTARVYVNRVWYWVFGAGLVASTDDFGHLGERPSHPELLDYLAAWFMDNGWSTRKLIRLMITSQAFRQSGQETPAAMAADPQNRLLHHYALRRLEAESIRDAILAVSGRLDPRLYGPSILPFRAHEDSFKRLFTGPLDGDGRRSIYTQVSLMEPPRFLAVFNQPPPKIPTGRRDVTNVPAQSLALLNDPFVIGQAEHWAAALVAIPHSSVDARLREMFQAALGRAPSEQELSRWSGLVNSLAADRAIPPGLILTEPAIWKDVAHTLFNTKEFIYIR